MDGCLYLTIFAYASFLLYKYILRSKEEQRRTKFFLMFYFLVIAICVCKVASWVDLEIEPDQILDFDFKILTCLTISIMLTLGWLVTATIFELTVSIREIFNLVSQSRTKWSKRVFYSFSILVCSLHVLAMFLIPSLVDEPQQMYQIVYNLIVAYSLLTVL